MDNHTQEFFRLGSQEKHTSPKKVSGAFPDYEDKTTAPAGGERSNLDSAHEKHMFMFLHEHKCFGGVAEGQCLSGNLRGGASRDRTDDLAIANGALSQTEL